MQPYISQDDFVNISVGDMSRTGRTPSRYVACLSCRRAKTKVS